MHCNRKIKGRKIKAKKSGKTGGHCSCGMKRPAESDDDEYLHNPGQQKEIFQELEIVNGTSMDSIIDKVAILDCGAQYGKVS